MIYKLNYVFDKWEGDKYITNLNHTGHVYDKIPHHLLRAEYVRLNFCKISDINDSENFYYLILYKQNLLQLLVSGEGEFLSGEVLDACRNKNLKVLLICEHEVNNDELDTLRTLQTYIQLNNLKEENFYFVDNNSLLDEYKKQLKTKINVHSIKFLFEFMMLSMKKIEVPLEMDKQFLFMNHNKTGKEHRVVALAYMKKHKMLDDTDWSFIDRDLRASNMWFDFRDKRMVDIKDEVEYVKGITGKLSEYENEEGWLNELNSDMYTPMNTMKPLTYMNSYVNIVTESMFFHGKEVHMSEKSFRPFYFFQLPIFIASSRHVEFLRKTYDLDMFDDLIDHSYDEIDNNVDRLFAVLEEIKRLHENKDQVIDFYRRNEDRLRKNRSKLNKMYKERPVSKFFIRLTKEITDRQTFFVFDKWDGDKPIPNSLNVSNIRNHLTPVIFDNSEYPVKTCGLDSVTKEDNYFYVVNYTHDLMQCLSDDNFFLSDEVIKTCIDKDLKIILINEHEINMNEKDTIKALIYQIKNRGMKESNFYYLNNNSKLEQYKTQLKSSLNVYTMRFLFEIMVESMLIHETEYHEDKEFLFLCHNRVSKEHRLLTLGYLKRNDILKDTDWSFLNPNENVDSFIDRNDKSLSNEYKVEMDYFRRIKNRPSKFELGKDWHIDTTHNPLNEKMMSDSYLNSYINIITETIFGWPEVHISEKSFRPFYFYQLPIFVASYRHVDYLKSMYGFDLFEDLIDHSYDFEPDNNKRLLMVLDEVKRLQENKEKVIQFYKDNRKRIEDNYNLMISLYKENQTLRYFKSLLNNDDTDVRPNPTIVTKRALITGSNGLVGRHLVKKCLESGYHVIGVDSKPPFEEDYPFILKDLTQPNAIESIFKKYEFDVVFNCFGVKGSPIRAKESPVDFLYPSFKINTEIINQCQKNDVWLVFVSSVGVYSPAEKFVEEDVWKTLPGQADWFPSWSKRMGEILLEAYKVQYGYDKWSIIRPANIFGEYDDFSGNGTVIASTIKKIWDATDEIVAWGDGTPIRDFVYAGDVADALIKLHRDEINATVNFGAGEEITIKSMIEELVRISTKNLKIKWDTSKPNGDQRRQMDITKQQELDLLPKLGFRDALRLTFNYFVKTMGKTIL